MNSIDFFKKPHSDAIKLQNTITGGIIAIFTLSFIFILIINEVYLSLFSKQMHIHTYIDNSNLDERIRINLNVSLLHVPCNAISLDIQDVTGAHLEDVKHTLHKLRLDQNQQFINVESALKVQSLEKYINYPSNPVIKLYKKFKKNVQIDDCYGAQLYQGQKCTTCQDVMLAYSAREWPLPPKEAIAQCMPDHKAKIKLDTFDQEIGQILAQATDEMMADISKQLSDTEEKMKNIEKEMQEKNITEEQLEKTQPLENLLSDQQKKHFSETIKELSEMNYNPQQWNDDRLRQEKVDRVESLINMLNLSLDDYTETLQGQIKFGSREYLVTERKLERKMINISTIERAKCEQDLKIFLNVTFNQESRNVSVAMPKDVCQLNVSYLAGNIDDPNNIDLQVFIGDDMTFDWRIEKQERNSLLASFYITIENLESDGNNQYSKRSRIDLSNNKLKFSVYIPIQTRLLYQEDFNVIKDQETYEVIEINKNEGCQVFGHLFIKRVPGNLRIGFLKGANFLANRFSMAHEINLFEITEEQSELSLGRLLGSTNAIDNTNQNNTLDQNSNYYLKVVSTIYEQQKLYTFTSHVDKVDSKEKLPQIIFRYEFDPITTAYERKYNNLAVSILAIIGGVYALSQFFSKLMFKIV